MVHSAGKRDDVGDTESVDVVLGVGEVEAVSVELAVSVDDGDAVREPVGVAVPEGVSDAVPVVEGVADGVGVGDRHTSSVAVSGVSAPLWRRYTPPPAAMT